MPTVSPTSKPESPQVKKKSETPKREGYREMVESIVVAFVLAFLFRTFEAEAFVIPTGSMAPTLMGRHKDVECPECGFDYEVSASEEHEGGGDNVAWATCPNCRYTAEVDDQLSFNGDRILVLKFPYTISDPQRFDVVVFKFPEDPKVNYIKRLVGLPGEQIRIRQGDLYVRPLDSADDAPWTIVRKTPRKQRVLAMEVYDNDHQSRLLREAGWPARWQPDPESAWSVEDEGKAFVLREPDDGEAWLVYQHLVPHVYDWQRIEQGGRVGDVRPQLITDCYGYNLGTDLHEGHPNPKSDGLGNHWVGDLVLSFEVDVHQATGELICELGEGQRRYRAVIDLASGQAALQVGNGRQWQDLATASTELMGVDDFRVSFANVDDQLLLCVNDEAVDFGPAAHYEAVPGNWKPTQGDLEPALIGVQGGSVSIRHLLLERDIYYALGNSSAWGGSSHDVEAHADRLADPEAWGARMLDREKIFDVEPGTYFVLGDNNPRSKDGRLWRDTNTVDAHLMIGQAFFIYWPHGIPFSFSVNVLAPFNRELYLPFLPQVGRMKLIR